MEEIKTKFMPWLEALHKDATTEIQIREEITSVLYELKAHIDRSYKRPEGMYSKIRKLIGDTIKDPETIRRARAVIKMSKEEYEASAAALRKVVEIKNRKQTVFSLKHVSDVVASVRKCTTFGDRFVFLQLACGARGVELLDANTSKFSATGVSSLLIRQDGFAKKKGSSKIQAIYKPLLWTSPANFLSELALLREDVACRDHQTRKDIAKSFSGQLSAFCKHLWFQHVANGHRTGTHLNRAIYANVAYKHYGDAGESLTHFVKRALGHDTMGSAANYMNINVAFPGEEKLIREAARQEDDIDRASVAFRDKDGHTVSIAKPPIRRMTKEERGEQIEQYAQKLRVANVTVNRSNLVALGFQSKAIRKEMLIRLWG